MSLITTIEIKENPEIQEWASSYQFELHDYLSDRADWDAPYWQLDLDRIVGYCNKLLELFNATTEGFSFQALWVGDKTKDIQIATIGELISMLKTDKIGTTTKYLVRKNA